MFHIVLDVVMDDSSTLIVLLLCVVLTIEIKLYI